MTDSNRLLLVTEQIEPGGKRSHVEALRAGLEARGWQAELFDRSRFSLVERAIIAGPTRLLDRLRRGLGHRWLLPTYDRVLESRLRSHAGRDEVRLYHVHEAVGFAAVRRVAGRRPVILTIHGPMHREVASAYRLRLEDPVVRMIESAERDAILAADAVIAVDRAHGEYARTFGRERAIHVIPNFVDTRRFHPGAPALPFGPDVEHWIAGRALLLCTRRLVPKNGVDVAIRAMAELEQRDRRCALVVVGDGPQSAELRQLIGQLGLGGCVRLLGSAASERIPGWCRRAAVVVVPSVPSGGVEEATSISVLEGQACARPVVASALGGIREIVEDGETGLLVPPGDPAALAASIERVLSEPALAAHLVETAWPRVRDLHSHEAGARQCEEVYRAAGCPPASAGDAS